MKEMYTATKTNRTTKALKCCMLAKKVKEKLHNEGIASELRKTKFVCFFLCETFMKKSRTEHLWDRDNCKKPVPTCYSQTVRLNKSVGCRTITPSQSSFRHVSGGARTDVSVGKTKFDSK